MRKGASQRPGADTTLGVVCLRPRVRCCPAALVSRSAGYWKNHPEAWPVSSLKLGTVSYTKTQLLQILNTDVSVSVRLRGSGMHGRF